MLRSKAALSVPVKQVIGALCSLLVATSLEVVPLPETFRRAKFGGGRDVEDQIWQLLANILQTAGIVSCKAYAQRRGASEQRKLVVAGLWQTGYYANWMYRREGGDGGEGGRFTSRDLLLALGWLLATGTLEKLLTQRVQQLDKTLLTPTSVNTQLSSELQLDSLSLRKLQWLIGCLRYQGQTLLSMQEEQSHLLYAVLFAVLPSTVASSDQSSKLLKEDCLCMRQLCDLLEAYLNWKRVEKVFWTWLDSVVDCHLTDPVVETPTHAPNGSARLCRNRGLKKFEEMLLQLPTGQGGPENTSLPPLLSCLPSLPSLPQASPARLQTVRPVKYSRDPAEGLHGGAQDPYELPSSHAVQVLLQTEALLLERRDGQRLASRMQLQEMVGRLDELVLIPP
ncbi:tubulin epsilon and delta complex protein 1 isoform X1 [Chaetodon trifascialis]|uniref:tubulin epsilon and delta complex protein 1 isoform X1 n=1 Tax=Chaetodon trifascialis TaxID=109706 RepID=UPI003991B011